MDRNQKVLQGRGSLKKLPDMMGKLNIRNPLIVGGSNLTGKLMRRVPVLLTSPVFSEYHPNPDLADALAGAEMYRKHECDGIISIGGGSAIDTAKAVKALLYVNDLKEAQQNCLPDGMTAPHIAIPGTAGTGAEATQNAVVYADGNKASLSHPDLRPDGAVLDPELLESLPEYHKKACALDALAQGIESYWCTASTDDSKVHAYLAIKGVLDNLKDYLDGDIHAADEMLYAAYQSGKAIQITRTTAAHAMSYRLTMKYGIAHGHAVMITLPVLWDMAAEHGEMSDILKEIAGIMRLGDPVMVPRLLRGITEDLGMKLPETPAENVLDELTDAVDPERLGNHPVAMSRTDIREAYRRAMTPLCPAEKQACLDIWVYYNR